MTTRLAKSQAVLKYSTPARGASEFSDRTAVLVDEERGGAFVKRRPGVCMDLLWGCTTKGVGYGSWSANISPVVKFNAW